MPPSVRLRLLALVLVPAAAGLAWQAGVVLEQGGATPLRGALLGLGVAALLAWPLVRRGGHPVLGLLLGSCASPVLWTSVLEVLVRRRFPDALGLLTVVGAALLHVALLAHAFPPGDRCGRGLRLLRRLSVATAATALLLVGVEALHRLRVPLHTYELLPDRPEPSRCLVRAADGRTRATPGFEGHWIHPEFDGVRVRINDWGLRDGTDEAVSPKDDQVSVLVLGDSFAFGLGVALEETFQERLEVGWPGNGPDTAPGDAPVRVTSGGIPGYGPGESREMLAELAPRVRPDHVVFALYEGNDFQDNASWRRRERVTPDAPPPSGAPPSSPPGALRTYLRGVGRFPFWAASCATVRAYRPALETLLVRLGRMSPQLHSNTFLNRGLRARPDAVLLALREELLDELDLLRADAARLGAGLTVLVVPAAVQAEPVCFEQFLAVQPGAERGSWSRKAFHEGLVAELVARGQDVVDTLPELERLATSGRSGYHLEGHWNGDGHRVAARLLGARLYATVRRP